MADRRGDYSKKSTTYKFYKKGYSSSKPKYVTAGQDLLIEQEVSGNIVGSADAGAWYYKDLAQISISGNGDSNAGLSANVIVRTDAARPFDLKGIVAQFSHSYSTTNMADVSNYSIYLFNYRITRNVSANTLSLYYKDGLVNSVTMSTDYDWLRLREVNGTVYIDRSADGTTWTNWSTQAVQVDDTRVSIMKVTADIGAGGLGNIFVDINDIDISDASGNLLAVESKKVLNDLSFTKNINTPAASTSLEMDYSPKDLPDSDVSLERIINHSTNPSFEEGGNTVEVRRNLSKLPRPRSSSDIGTVYTSDIWSWERTSGGSDTPYYDNGDMVVDNPYVASDAWGINTGTRGLAYSTYSEVTAGRTYTISLGVTVVGTGTFSMYLRTRNQSDAIIHTGPTEVLGAGSHRISITFTIPAGTTSIDHRNIGVSITAGVTQVRLSKHMVEEIGAPLPYFDGSTNDGFDIASLTPSWTGTANNSASILTGVSVPGSSSYNTYTSGALGFPVWLSTDNPHNGKSFARGLVKHTSVSTYSIAGTVDIPPNTYRNASLVVRANRNIEVQPRWQLAAGGGAGAVPIGPEHTITNSWSEIRRYGSTDKNNAAMDMLINDATAGDIIDIDEHFMIPGDEYTGPYFDGSTSANTGWLGDGTSYKDNFTDKYEVENSHLLFGNTIEAIVGFKNNKIVTPEKKSILKFSGYIDAIDRDYNNDVISVTAISHGEILSNVLVGYADENVESTLISQTAQNANESTTNRRQTFIPRVATKLSGARVRLTYAGGGSATLAIGTGSTILASSKTMTWSGSLSAGVYNLALLSPIFLEAGKTYWLSVDGIVNWYYQNTNVYADGSRQQLSGGTWSNVAGDAYFELYTSNPSVVFEYSGSVEGLVDRVFQETDSNYGLVSKGTVVNPAYNIGVNAAVDNGRSLLETALKMSPIGYWSSINLGSGEYDLKPYPTTAEHTLIFGRDFTEFNLSEAISNIVNDVPFIGGDIDSVQTKLAIRTNDRASMGAYKLGLSVESNGKVTRYDSAQLLSDYEIQNNNKPRQTTSIVIPASEYDIETFDTGQLVKILNADSEQLVKGLLIASVDYTPERAILSLDSAPQTITSSVDKIKRDLNNSETSGVSGVI